MKVINYDIYSVKKNDYGENKKDLLIMHVDATLEDDQGNKFDISVNDLDNHELTVDLFSLVGEKIINQNHKSESNGLTKLTKVNKPDNNEDKQSKANLPYKKISSPETIINKIKNISNHKPDYQELPTSSYISGVGLNINHLTSADFSNNNADMGNKKKDKKREIDLTSGNDGLYHEENPDQEENGFGNDE